MLRDNPVGLIEPMFSSAGANPLALCIAKNESSDDRPPCLENPRPEGAESTLTENTPSPFHAEPKHYRLGFILKSRWKCNGERPPNATLECRKSGRKCRVESGLAHYEKARASSSSQALDPTQCCVSNCAQIPKALDGIIPTCELK